jgi:hypothetical protein
MESTGKRMNYASGIIEKKKLYQENGCFLFCTQNYNKILVDGTVYLHKAVSRRELQHSNSESIRNTSLTQLLVHAHIAT